MTPPTPPRSVRIPDAVWHAARERAEREGTTVTAVILRALVRYANAKPKEGQK
jgi:hypothetical protein